MLYYDSEDDIVVCFTRYEEASIGEVEPYLYVFYSQIDNMPTGFLLRKASELGEPIVDRVDSLLWTAFERSSSKESDLRFFSDAALLWSLERK